MSEIKDKNKLVIKNSATIELERRKGFVNILLQGNPNLYRAWVERNNKIVIDISGESTEYNLDTETPDYIEIVKNQSDNKYYINFIGSITGDGNLVSDDITFSQEGDNTRLTIKSSKFVSTSKIQSGTPDYLYVNVDESGNVRVGLTQDTIQALLSISQSVRVIEANNSAVTATQDDVDNYGFDSTGLAIDVGRNYLVTELAICYDEFEPSKMFNISYDNNNCITILGFSKIYRYDYYLVSIVWVNPVDGTVVHENYYANSATVNLRSYELQPNPV